MEGRPTGKPCAPVHRRSLRVQHVDTGHDPSPGCRLERALGLDAFRRPAGLFGGGDFFGVDDIFLWKVGGSCRTTQGGSGGIPLLVHGACHDGGGGLLAPIAAGIPSWGELAGVSCTLGEWICS